MTEKEFQEAYAAFQKAVQKVRENNGDGEVTLAYHHACILEVYMFDPDAGFEENVE